MCQDSLQKCYLIILAAFPQIAVILKPYKSASLAFPLPPLSLKCPCQRDYSAYRNMIPPNIVVNDNNHSSHWLCDPTVKSVCYLSFVFHSGKKFCPLKCRKQHGISELDRIPHDNSRDVWNETVCYNG